MKKVPFLLMISFILAVTNVNANIVTIPPPKIQVQLTNLKDFPEVVIVEFIESALPIFQYRLITGNSLTMSPVTGKFVHFYITKKKYLEKVGFDNIDWSTDKNVQKLNVITGSPAPAVNIISLSANPATQNQFSAIDVNLKLAKKNNTYYVYKSKVAGKLRTNSSQQAPSDIVKDYKDDVADLTAPILISESIL